MKETLTADAARPNSPAKPGAAARQESALVRRIAADLKRLEADVAGLKAAIETGKTLLTLKLRSWKRSKAGLHASSARTIHPTMKSPN
jgi:hypothetical protein